MEARGEENLVSDLRSLVFLETETDVDHHDITLMLYHKSFSDFLEEESRAKDLFVPEDRTYTHLEKCYLQRALELWPLDLDSGA
jgi:hypothetical protein